ncbi:conserved hypothetical protein [Lebetimonas natsushimae]|uniref:Uncharacterized protein n=1 Tax=Lebetimonas natsushimae TaxID=1936991 RepID=A0A292YF07_9BACT|nr:hypothetical protein [Lebetimonas natsushimae]GAX87644.1 conserved hypothetical protein [Lebetimonas natsushimae]
MIGILFKNNKLSSYPAEILVDEKIYKNIDEVDVNVIAGLSMPSEMIEKLRKKGIMFLKIKSLDELKDLNIDINVPKEWQKRGWKCGKKGF